MAISTILGHILTCKVNEDHLLHRMILFGLPPSYELVLQGLGILSISFVDTFITHLSFTVNFLHLPLKIFDLPYTKFSK